MTKAFWTIVANDNADGTNKPSIPQLPSVRATVPGDLWTLPPGASGASSTHRHLVIGSAALPSFNIASKHMHFVFKNGAFTYQRLIHESESQHTHPDPALSYFICFVVCDEADYVTLTTGSPPPVRPVVHAEVTVDSEGNDVIGDLETTAWTTGQRNAWANAILANLGIQLAPEIDRGRRLIAFLLEMSLARRHDNERGLRGQ